MHRETPLHFQLYHILFPFGTSEDNSDPASWTEHVRKNIVPELRREVHMFYGDALAHTVEARFPGLDYALPIHRQRLRRFPHHRRLFDVFDELGLTSNEIYRLCDWEGTLWVKRRYEAGRGPIRETAGDFIFGGRDDRASRVAKRAARVEVRGEDGNDEEEDEDVEATEVVEHEDDGEEDEEVGMEGEAGDEGAATAEPAPARRAQYQAPPASSTWPGTPTVAVSSSGLRMQMTSSGARPPAARAAA